MDSGTPIVTGTSYRTNELQTKDAPEGVVKKFRPIPSDLSGFGSVQRHGGANQGLQSLLLHLFAFAEIDSAP